MNFEQLKSLVAEKYPSMSRQLQIAARYILDNPEDVAMVSMRQLAGEADVHPSTMVRLAQFLDFESYNDFRDLFQNRLRAAPGDIVARARGLQGHEAHLEDLINEVQSHTLANISQTLGEGEGRARLLEAAHLIEGANTLYVAGLRTSHAPAFSFYYAYSIFRDNARLLRGQAGTLYDEIRCLKEGDVFLVIGADPYSTVSVRTAQFARENGAQVIAIVDSELAPICAPGDCILVARNDTPTLFPSMTAYLLVVEALVTLLVAKGGNKVIEAASESNRQLEQFGTYWTGPAPSSVEPAP